MIVISDDLVLSVPLGDLNAPVVGWRNSLTASNVTSEAALVGFPVTNLANPSTYLKWKSGSLLKQHVRIELGAPTQIDYLAIAGHNFGTAQVAASVEGALTSDTAQKALLHFNGTAGSTVIADSNIGGGAHAWTASGDAQIDASRVKFGSGSLLCSGNGAFTKALLHLDGADTSTTITDSNAGGSAHAWTAVGNAQIDTALFKFGGSSLLLDGTGDWVTTPDSADFTLGLGDFTIDFWARPNIDGTFILMCGQLDAVGSPNANSAWYVARRADNKIDFVLCQGGGQTVFTTTTTNIVAGSWYHVELSRLGTQIYMFVNGVLEGGGAYTGPINDSAAVLGVGSGGNFVGTPWNGWIDEFRLSVGIARHTTNFIPLTSAYGVGGFVDTPDSADFNLGSGDFTIDLWFNCTAATGTVQRIAGQNADPIVAATTSFAMFRDASNHINARVSNGAAFFTITGTTAFTNLVNPGWHHMAFVRVGNVLKLFIDGVQEGGDLAFTGSVVNSANRLAVGRQGEENPGAAGGWIGWIDEFRMLVGRAAWTANFRPEDVEYDQWNWRTFGDEQLPADDQPIIWRFAEQTLMAVRLVVTPTATAPEVAVMYTDTLLEFQRRIYVGHRVLQYNRRSNVVTGFSDEANFLGRIVLGELNESALDLHNITPSFYRTDMEPWLRNAVRRPFFFAWRPTSYPLEVGFCWLTSDSQMSNQRPNGMVQVSAGLRGIVQ